MNFRGGDMTGQPSLPRTSIGIEYRGLVREARTYLRRCLIRDRTPSTKFLLVGMSRSGSTLLVTLLDSHPLIHCEDEILHYRVLLPRAYIASRAALSGGEAYGFKLLSYQLRNVQKISDPRAFLGKLVDRGFKFVYPDRRNLLRWALSNLYARSRSQFHQYRSEQSESLQANPGNVGEGMRVDLAELGKWLHWGTQVKDQLGHLLSDLAHLRLTYETDLESSAQHQATVDRVCRYLGLPPAKVATDLVKITPTNLQDLIINYQETVEFVSAAGYSEYLDPD